LRLDTPPTFPSQERASQLDERTTKVCTVCQQSLPNTLEFFALNTRTHRGLLARCRPCTAAYYRAWRQKNPEKARANVQRYYAKDLAASKARWRRNATRYRAKHKETVLRRQRARRHADIDNTRQEANAYRQAHPETFRQAQKAWERNNPHDGRLRAHKRRLRTRNVAATFTAEDWEFCLNYWQYACALCGAQQDEQKKLAMDHWIPISSPLCPGTTPSNILVLCHGIGGCNNSKHDNDPIYWMEQKLGKRAAEHKFQEIERYFAVVRKCQDD